MRNEQIEKFLEYLARDRVLQRDLARRARTPEQFYFNAARFSGLFGYSFSADQLRAWVEAAGGLDLTKLTTGQVGQTATLPTGPTSTAPSEAPHSAAGDSPLRAA